ncbi:MAG: TonB family protein [Pseudomonadota bacterium]
MKLGAISALTLSLGAHLSLATFVPERDVEMLVQGGGEPALAAIGSSFEELVREGDITEPDVLDEAAATSVEPLESLNDVYETLSAETEPSEVVGPASSDELVRPASTATPQTATQQPATTAPTNDAEPVEEAPIESEYSAPTPDRLAPAAPQDKQARPTTPLPFAKAPQLRALLPEQPQTSASDRSSSVALVVPTSPADVVEARPDEPQVPIPSSRPWRPIDQQRLEDAKREAAEAERRRVEQEKRDAAAAKQRSAEKRATDRRQAEKRAAERKKSEETRRSVGQKSANSTQNAKRGNQSGSKKGRAAQTRSAPKRQSKKAGNAAASNYPGKVQADIARTRKKRAGARGTAHIRFTVTASGGLGSVRVSRGSGNSKVDRAAVAHIQRSAPFPKPPPGAQRTFVIPIEFLR